MFEHQLGPTVTVAVPLPSTSCRVRDAWSSLTARSRVSVAALLAAHLAAVANLATGAHLATGRSISTSTTLALWLVGGLAAAAAIVDLVEQRIPNRLVGAIAITVLLAVTVDPQRLLPVSVGAVLAGLPLVWVLLRRGLGMGDVKLATVLGAAVGLVDPLVALTAVFAASLAAGTNGLVSGRERAALAPWIWGGTVVAIGAASIGVQP